MSELGNAAYFHRVFALLATAGLLTACGDVDTFNLRPGEWGDLEPLTDWGGVVVELQHVSARCEAPAEGLRAAVGDELEFQDCATAISRKCATEAVPVAIDVQPRSILYDFSNIAQPGKFEGEAFNGYVLADLLGLGPRILRVRVDAEHTTLALDQGRIVVADGAVHVNFAGLPFDDTDFVKLDLEFAD